MLHNTVQFTGSWSRRLRYDTRMGRSRSRLRSEGCKANPPWIGSVPCRSITRSTPTEPHISPRYSLSDEAGPLPHPRYHLALQLHVLRTTPTHPHLAPNHSISRKSLRPASDVGSIPTFAPRNDVYRDRCQRGSSVVRCPPGSWCDSRALQAAHWSRVLCVSVLPRGATNRVEVSRRSQSWFV